MWRHLPLVLLGGWLLMVPPAKTTTLHDGTSTEVLDKDAPISRWEQDSAYDTARECQAGMAALAKRPIPASMAPAYMAARCVPSEAVYPKEPASK